MYKNPFTISPALTGDAVFKLLELTGWSNSDTNNSQGRLYWAIVNDTLSFYSNPERTELVAEGDITAGEVDLAEEGASGISGSAKLTHTQDSTGFIVVTYCKESDLLLRERDLLDHITSGQYSEATRFEGPLKEAKEHIDKVLRGRPDVTKFFKANRQVDLSVLLNPWDLAAAQAYWALHLIMLSVNNGDSSIMDLCKFYESKSNKELDLVDLQFDYNRDDIVDEKQSVRGVRFER